jgi:hypothetical protein
VGAQVGASCLYVTEQCTTACHPLARCQISSSNQQRSVSVLLGLYQLSAAAL